MKSAPTNPGDSARPSRWADRLFHAACLAGALSVLVLLVLVAYQLYHGSQHARTEFGWKFLISTTWDPVDEHYGALPFIYGTFMTAFIGLLIAVPLSVGSAIYLTELAPLSLRQPLVSVIEMLAAVPSVIWGLWGIFVLVPFLRVDVYPFLQKFLGFLPVFQGPIYGIGVMTGGVIVAIMILPIVTSVSREVVRSVPNLQREAAYGLGATRWEVTRIAVLSYARRGIFGAAVLGLGRALGETMAVTMVIGNSSEISKSLFAPGYTMASVIANEFAEATTDRYLSALFAIGLVLLGLTIVINILAALMIRAISSAETRRVH
ncbi:MAG TPA: phosphate ABC transporter permease subunit PstC [Lacunisphaera sp.]|nr:phosphate ABC transporter permease subunit PstC [Lacunisphaera sp.]